ncbi:MAG TPA: hypothetical protein VK590_06590 [Saprospiraceae bacterium]|nr:hypothetical protein [Saprospiraceae bacterium]
METLNMDAVGRLGEQLKEFEEKMYVPMVKARDTIENTLKGDFKNIADKHKYEEICIKCNFLENFISSIRETISIAGVAGDFGEDYVKTVAKFHIGKTDELFKEQKEQIERLNKKSQFLFGYVTIS